MGYRATYFLQTVDIMVGYNDVEGGPIPDTLVYNNYPTLIENSMEHMNMINIDVDILEDILYYPNMEGFDYYHKVMAKYQEWGVKCYLYDVPYRAEIGVLQNNKLFEGLVH